MNSLNFTARTASDGVVEREFTVGDVPGVLWSSASVSGRTPLVLMGHGGGQHKRTPALVARARHVVTACGYAVVAIDAPGHGDRVRTEVDEQARSDLRHALENGEPIGEISSRYGATLARQAVPEWRATLDALQKLPEIGDGGPVGYGGGVTLGTGIGIPLTAAEPRISAAIFGNGFVVHEALLAAARRITVPVLFLLQWDDEHVDRDRSLGLFDAFASPEKTLHANPGGHARVPSFEDPAPFLTRHLGRREAAPDLVG